MEFNIKLKLRLFNEAVLDIYVVPHILFQSIHLRWNYYPFLISICIYESNVFYNFYNSWTEIYYFCFLYDLHRRLNHFCYCYGILLATVSSFRLILRNILWPVHRFLLSVFVTYAFIQYLFRECFREIKHWMFKLFSERSTWNNLFKYNNSIQNKLIFRVLYLTFTNYWLMSLLYYTLIMK